MLPENLPGAHITHELSPVMDEYVPTVQYAHVAVADPMAAENLPMPHLIHAIADVCPSCSEYVPEGHALQSSSLTAEIPGVDKYFPAIQSMHGPGEKLH